MVLQLQLLWQYFQKFLQYLQVPFVFARAAIAQRLAPARWLALALWPLSLPYRALKVALRRTLYRWGRAAQ